MEFAASASSSRSIADIPSLASLLSALFVHNTVYLIYLLASQREFSAQLPLLPYVLSMIDLCNAFRPPGGGNGAVREEQERRAQRCARRGRRQLHCRWFGGEQLGRPQRFEHGECNAGPHATKKRPTAVIREHWDTPDFSSPP